MSRRVSSTRTRPTTTGFLSQRALNRDIAELIATRIDRQRTGLALDVGCGNVPYGELLPGWNRVGINIDADDAQPDVVGDGLKLPFRTGCAEVALCTQVVEHVKDPFQLVRELSRTLKVGGILILSGPMYWPLHEEPFDFWRFTEHGFRELCRQGGLEVLEIRRQGGAIALTAISINHLFRGIWFLPVRLIVNLSALVLDSLIPIRHSTPNLTLAAKKLPSST